MQSQVELQKPRDAGIFLGEIVSRAAGGGFSAAILYDRMSHAPEALRAVGEKAMGLYNNIVAPLFNAQRTSTPSDSAELASALHNYKKLVFDHTTKLRMPETPDLIMGGVVGALLLTDTYFTARRLHMRGLSLDHREPDQFGWGHAAWEGFKAACAVATPALLHGLLTSVQAGTDPRFVGMLSSPEVLTEIAINGTGAIIGGAQILTSGGRVVLSLVDMIRSRQAGIDARREDRKAQTQELKTALERAIATGEFPANPALAETVTVLIENTDARRQVRIDSRQQAIKDRKERDVLRKRREQEKAIPVPQPAFSLDEAVGRVNFSLQEWRFYMKQLFLKVKKSPVDPPGLLPSFLEKRQQKSQK